MVYVRELREGNWIKSETELFGKKSWNEWQVNIEDFEYIKKNPENYFGIPLTEEWFLKFGFVKDNDNFYLNGITLFLHEKKWNYIIGDLGYKLGTSIEYVHRIQNLYFELTQKELIL